MDYDFGENETYQRMYNGLTLKSRRDLNRLSLCFSQPCNAYLQCGCQNFAPQKIKITIHDIEE